MKGSIIFRQTLALVLATVFLSSVLTVSVFYLVSRNTFAQDKAQELQIRANGAATIVASYLLGQRSVNELRKAMERSPRMFPVNFVAFDREGYVLILKGRSEDSIDEQLINESLSGLGTRSPLVSSTPAPEEAGQNGEPNALSAQQMEYLQKNIQALPQVFNGETVTRIDTHDEGHIVVGAPVYDDLSGEVIGAVFLSQPLTEINAARDSLYITLVISMLSITCIMVMLAFFASQRISRPIYAIRNVADAMSRGDFQVRADSEQPAELGELAFSLNYLSGRLSQTINELVTERNRLRHILDGLNEGIVAIDRLGQITSINPAVVNIFGEPLEPLESRLDFIGDPELWDDFDAAIEQTCTVVRSLKIDGKVLRVSISPIEDEVGEIVGAVGLFRDVTESERLEQTRRDYVANVSHELRTPISSVRSLAETLVDGLIKTEEDKARYYGYILHEALRLSRLVDDLLELSRLQSGTIAVAPQRVDMNALLFELTERFEPLAAEKQITFSLKLDEDCPDAFSNADRVEQVLVVLLDNAIKFTGEGGQVSVGAQWDEKKIYLSVGDNGCGIAKEDLPHVFERFYKADKAHTGSGTGLGLSICKEVLQLMGEKIEVRSQEGAGTTFTFTLTRCEKSGANIA